MHLAIEFFEHSLPLVIIFLAGGLTSGFLAGLLGVGGGAILVPILYEAFSFIGVDESVRMHMVLGTSFAVIAPTTFRSAYVHWSKNAVEKLLLTRLAPWVSGGALLGVAMAGYFQTKILIWIWVVGSGLMAAKIGFGSSDLKLGNNISYSLGFKISSLLIGTLSALLSIGGGMFFVSLFRLYSVPMLTSIATSAGLGTFVAFPSVFAYMLAGIGVDHVPAFSIGYVNPLAAALIIPTSLYAVPWGVNLAHSISHRKLEILFAVYLIFVCINFLRKVL